MSKLYVQHVSGKGEKFCLHTEMDDSWYIENPGREQNNYWLPKSEYRICEPPERWTPCEDAFIHLDFIYTPSGTQIHGPFRAKVQIERRVVDEVTR